jgi:hypothetical protein
MALTLLCSSASTVQSLGVLHHELHSAPWGCSSASSAPAAPCATRSPRGSSRVRARRQASIRGSARVPAQLCVHVGLALCKCWHSSVRAEAAQALWPSRIAKRPATQHVPPADQIACPAPLLVPLLLSLSLSSIPCFPSSLLCQVGGCCHILCQTGLLVRAFRRGQPKVSLRCLATIARCRRRAGPAAGRRRAGPAAALQPLGLPATAMGRPLVRIASSLLLETVLNGG